MKMMVLIFGLLVSVSTMARQYTQCSDLDKQLYSVVNLPTLENGTLFVTLGAETDVHQLYHIEKIEEKEDGIHYKLVDAVNESLLIFPKGVFGTNNDSIRVDVFESGVHHRFSCFTRVYED